LNTFPSITLNKLLHGFVESESRRNPDISGIAVDSRMVKNGDLFFACKGANLDGTRYIKNAIDAGAVAIVVDSTSRAVDEESVPVCVVENLNIRLGEIATRFYQQPTEQMKVVGITGTNGKTSCSHIMAQCLTQLDITCGVIGTMGAGVWGQLKPLANTTPGAVELQKLLAELRDEKAQVVSMEVSSHGLEQHRVSGCQFDVAVFTNLSRDHLDYHGDMKSYGASKLKLFVDYSVVKVVVNLDDDFARNIIDALQPGVAIIGTTLNCDTAPTDCGLLKGEIVNTGRTGTQVKVESEWGQGEFHTSLLGDFNMSNLLNVLATLLLLDVSFEDALKSLESAQAPNGRLETYFSENSPLVVVDYAHTPDALEKALLTLKHHTVGKLFVLFGCGGDRDKGKRPEMGVVAEKFADVVWITNDNPRSEKPELIAEDILANIKEKDRIIVELDREKAIRGIINTATVNDVVLVAGKGHEYYQIFGAEYYDFSDRAVVAAAISEAA